MKSHNETVSALFGSARQLSVGPPRFSQLGEYDVEGLDVVGEWLEEDTTAVMLHGSRDLGNPLPGIPTRDLLQQAKDIAIELARRYGQ